MRKKVYFVGAGPGDPELLTLKGLALLKQADVIVYTGSLINPSMLHHAKSSAQKYDSATMHLDGILQLIEQKVKQSKKVVRLCGGDPSLYGASQEQIDLLRTRGIECEVVPGVSSFLAAAATLGRELTLPGITQTVIITRPPGRTPVSKSENLKELAKHGATMIIFLGIKQIRKLCKELEEGGYPKTTPVAVLHKVTWPEEAILRGTLRNIASKVERSKISKTAIVIVGRILAESGYKPSKLYDPAFTHMYRKGGVTQRSKKASQ